MIEQSWKQEALMLHNTTNMSWRQIAKELGVAKSSVSDYLRKATKESPCSEDDLHVVATVGTGTRDCDNSRILVISDLHAPYNHPKALDWLRELKAKYNPTRVICVGDEVDNHSISFHSSDPDLMGAGDELKAAIEVIQELHDIFPIMDLLDSNHGSLAYRRAKADGIPRHFLKGYNEVLGVGKGWVWYHDLTITLPNGQPCYFHHGKSARGVQLSQNMAMNCVQGHHHSAFNIEYWSNPLNLFWSMQVGCLIDDKSLAMAYNKLTVKRPIIGTGLIIDSKPILETMDL